MTREIAVLFIRKDSIYKELVEECFDIERNAAGYNFKLPVICHPPCRAWGRLRHFAKPREGEKELALFSVDLVRKFGGIVEHPRSSLLWFEKDIPRHGEVDQYGGFCISVNQSWFGHKAEKNTLLYICGIDRKNVPSMPLNFNAIERTISGSFRRTHPSYRKEVSKAEREATPLLFAEWLIQLAVLCKAPK